MSSLFCSRTNTPHKFKFKTTYSIDQRYSECSRIRKLYPDRLPIIVETSLNYDIPTLDKMKYLVPSDLTVGQFMYVIRKRLKLTSEKAIFFCINGTIPSSSSLIINLYELYHDETDGFLYILINGENTFG